MKKMFILLLTVLLSLTACSEISPPQESSQAPTEITILPTKPPEPTPTDTPVPSETPEPTNTYTPIPMDTPTITPTFSPETLTFSAGEPLRIGYLLWETHQIGVDSIRSMEIAINDFGGELYGHPIEITGLNSECNALAAQRGAQILIRDDTVIGIIGTSCSGGALRAAPIVSDGGRVLISPSASSPELTAPDSHAAGFFRTFPNDLFQVRAAAQYAFTELGVRRLATVFAANDKYQLLMNNALCEIFTEIGGECVLQRTMEAGSTYMPPIVNSLVDVTPDAIYFMSWNSQVSAAFLSEARATPDLESAAFFIWEGSMNPDFIEQAGDDAVGVYVSMTSHDIDQETDIYRTFLDAYRWNFNEQPITQYHPFAYDATTLLLKAISQVAVLGEDGSLFVDPMAVRDALYSLDEFLGLSGLISCSPYGDCAHNVEGKIFEFTSGDPSTFNPGPADLLSSNPSQVWP